MLHNFDLSHTYRQISTSLSLTKLHLTGDTLHTHEGPTISLPHLRSLRINLWEDHIISLIHSLHAPALEHFYVDLNNIYEGHNTFTGSLESALRSAGHSPYPVLQSLTLFCAHFSSSAAKAITMKLPSVKHLSLVYCETRATLWRCLLTPVDGVGIPCPQLETISLTIHKILEDGFHPSELELLRDIVTDRITRKIPLPSITFDSHTLKLDVTFREQLEWLKRTGVSVLIRVVKHVLRVSQSRSDTNAGLCSLSPQRLNWSQS